MSRQEYIDRAAEMVIGHLDSLFDGDDGVTDFEDEVLYLNPDLVQRMNEHQESWPEQGTEEDKQAWTSHEQVLAHQAQEFTQALWAEALLTAFRRYVPHVACRSCDAIGPKVELLDHRDPDTKQGWCSRCGEPTLDDFPGGEGVTYD